MRFKNLAKLIKAITLLSSATGTTIEELAAELSLDRRSVYRMFEDLEGLGFPLFDDRDLGEKKKTWRLDSGYVKKLPNLALPDIKLDLNELLSLCLAASRGGGYKGTIFETSLTSALGKIGMMLPAGLLPKLSRLQVLFHSSGKQVKEYAGHEATIENSPIACSTSVPVISNTIRSRTTRSRSLTSTRSVFLSTRGGSTSLFGVANITIYSCWPF
jgi:HTH domain